ncbi:protein RETICULATA-RELATED 3, chloroplastic-like [Phoenix dactylifera]|uniref:Protein RETICULATA-RELATED 3, chloroplastic-like n=1 Tax=Phoenix dactylifera TaxID=42345 RepID=A0A8B7BJ01_PHODC|nr:protein RETICULATA-RELATED 3, chloroplastic-like [Phoenix dactylifera]
MAAQLRLSPLPKSDASHLAEFRRLPAGLPKPASIPLRPSATSAASLSLSLSLLSPRSSNPNLSQSLTSPDLPVVGGSGDIPPAGSGGGGGGGWGSDGAPGDHHHGEDPSSDRGAGGPLGLFLEGWRSRVSADPQFPFKVLMEELVGVTACVLGDMASRPNFGLNELDFVFSTMVVGSIVNFVLMYLLAPTAATAATASSIFPSHMFEPGAYSLLSRLGTIVYKGATFAAVGFAAGLAGTAISNGLISLRKKMDPEFHSPNKPPPPVLNALTWALHMGISSNLRYQSLNGLEFVMEKALPPAGFKASVVVLRSLNNVLGGMSFVVLARLTGSQKVEGEEEKSELKERLVDDGVAADGGDVVVQRSESQPK